VSWHTASAYPSRTPAVHLALVALAVVNSPLAPLYDLVHHTPISLHVGAFVIDKPLILWINEGLMVFFFLLHDVDVDVLDPVMLETV